MTTIIRRMVLSRVIPFDIVGKRQLSALVSASLEFPKLPEVFPQANKCSESHVTSLSNGLTVVTENSAASSTVSLTFPNAGSSSESVGEHGAALVNKCLAFKSGSSLSSALILRNLEDDGAIPFATAGRTSAAVGFTSSPDKVSRLIPLLATKCTFEKWDVRDALAAANREVEEALTNAEIVLTEQLFGAAYGPQSSMGRAFYSLGGKMEQIQSFREKAYSLKGSILAATGIQEHDEFCKIVEEGFAEASQGVPEEEVAIPSYMGGGEARTHVSSMNAAHVALAFKAPERAALSSILQECLLLQGASTSFSCDGLIGVYGSEVDAMCEALLKKPSEDIITRARMAIKAKTLIALENSSSYDLAKTLTFQVYDGITHSTYDEVSDNDIVAAYDAMLKSGITMAAVGNLNSVPYQGTVATRFI
mmetsp:Transcript_18333/g.20418  ORF Transcript_18333/g.20418 Transcript_18333/m.20418 type:complete len:421 (+) Transcript_18333:34-1296(+)|eukprot:CAMPEP_0194145388 /NCGR_PEP_ID=MMETSP0152-20130528/17293_1 /TAXON_ID=1049557 /ORGANISM="Thalassiothrix antarctica, Strain L6-D1" /LENGTH=420 /DNA_ID=CAMNT_0038845617 /DNA_START=38 /DNA_END=1300 /DNA_ORIENTATION=+